MADNALPFLTVARQEMTGKEAEAVLTRLAAKVKTSPEGFLTQIERPPSPGLEPRGDRAARPEAPPSAHQLLTVDTLLRLLEAVPDALVVADQEGRIVRVNAQTERLFGYHRDELVGHPVELLVPERFREKHVTERAGYFADPEIRPMGTDRAPWGRHKDGHEVPVEISLSPLATAAGLLVVSTIRDVSERKRAEAQLRKMEARYRTLVEGIPAVTFMAALDEGVNELYVSPQVEKLLGFTQKEWLENPILWYTQLHEGDRPRWHEEFARTIAAGEDFSSVYRFISKKERVVWVQGNAKVVRDEDGRPLFLQGVAFDITGIKEAENELKALNETLNQRVEERTQELEQSNKALEQFAGRAAHDLEKPVATVNSNLKLLAGRHRGSLDSWLEILVGEGLITPAELAAKGPREAVIDYFIARSLVIADRMLVRIADVLTYSQARSHKKEPTPIDLTAALEAARAHLQKAIADSGADVKADHLPTVMADRTQLGLLLENLINNALKYREEGHRPCITVSAKREGRFWEIAVSDDGIGIEQEHLQSIFGLGERLHNADSQYPGSGIGLATCQTIVERHSGRIWATSPGLGQGSTFFFTLPAAEQD